MDGKRATRRWSPVDFMNLKETSPMLYYALVFFIVALVAAVFGFGGLAAGAASIAKLLFVGFLVLAVVTGVAALLGGGSRRLR